MFHDHLTLIISIGVAAILLLVILFVLWRRSPSNSTKLYIGNVPYRARISDIKEVFSDYGPVESVRIVRDRNTGKAKGFAFVTFYSEKSATDALSADGMTMLGRSLVVRMAINK